MYLEAFLERSTTSSAVSQDKIYIPGRLHYHLDLKYGYVKGDVHAISLGGN